MFTRRRATSQILFLAAGVSIVLVSLAALVRPPTSRAAPGYIGPNVTLGLNAPNGVAVDGSGNVYFADLGHNAIEEWVKSSGTVTTLVSSGLNAPGGVAVDVGGNVYIADTNDNVIVVTQSPTYFPPNVYLPVVLREAAGR
jgi:hypothetical protein